MARISSAASNQKSTREARPKARAFLCLLQTHTDRRLQRHPAHDPLLSVVDCSMAVWPPFRRREPSALASRHISAGHQCLTGACNDVSECRLDVLRTCSVGCELAQSTSRGLRVVGAGMLCSRSACKRNPTTSEVHSCSAMQQQHAQQGVWVVQIESRQKLA